MVKFENEELIDWVSGEMQYVLRIYYEGEDGERYKYTYNRNVDQAEGEWKVHKEDEKG